MRNLVKVLVCRKMLMPNRIKDDRLTDKVISFNLIK